MAGYSWSHGKSNNAVRAERDGRMVASKLAAWLRKIGGGYRGCTTADVRHVLPRSEWHHTSKFFNEVEYYDPRDLAELDLREDLKRAIANRKLSQKLICEHQRRGMKYILHADGLQWLPISLIDRDDERRYEDWFVAKLQRSLALADQRPESA